MDLAASSYGNNHYYIVFRNISTEKVRNRFLDRVEIGWRNMYRLTEFHDDSGKGQRPFTSVPVWQDEPRSGFESEGDDGSAALQRDMEHPLFHTSGGAVRSIRQNNSGISPFQVIHQLIGRFFPRMARRPQYDLFNTHIPEQDVAGLDIPRRMLKPGMSSVFEKNGEIDTDVCVPETKNEIFLLHDPFPAKDFNPACEVNQYEVEKADRRYAICVQIENGPKNGGHFVYMVP